MVVITEPNGKVLQTEGAGHGKVLWRVIQVTTSVVAVNKKGILSLPHDPRLSDGKDPRVTITIPSHPDIHAELDVPVQYNHPFTANFSGGPGFSGANGMDGSDGTSGSMGSTDPNNPSAGGDGGNGSDGSNGGGMADRAATRRRYRCWWRSGLEAHPLLQISVSAAGKRKLYLVDPQGGSLTVKADGGPGGYGGKGGRGGRGGSGGMGSPSGSSGSNGSDGRDGSNGPPGKAGRITVTYDPQAKPYLTALHLSNQGGPKPVFQEQSVAPLW